MWLTLKALEQLGGSGGIEEINSAAIGLGAFSEEQQAVPGPQSHPQYTKITYRLSWSRTLLKMVGATENSARGVWAITKAGRAFQEADMERVLRKARAISRERRGRRGQAEEAQEAASEDLPEDGDQIWKPQLLETLMTLEPSAFERLSQRLLREEGFVSVRVTGQAGDGGIDGTGVLRFSLLSFPVFFQCKRYEGSVGARHVRDFRGAMAGRGEKGLLITTGSFTAEAEHEATRDGVAPIDLIDGDQLCDLLKSHQLGVREQVVIDADWFERL